MISAFRANSPPSSYPLGGKTRHASLKRAAAGTTPAKADYTTSTFLACRRCPGTACGNASGPCLIIAIRRLASATSATNPPLGHVAALRTRSEVSESSSGGPASNAQHPSHLNLCADNRLIVHRGLIGNAHAGGRDRDAGAALHNTSYLRGLDNGMQTKEACTGCRNP